MPGLHYTLYNSSSCVAEEKVKPPPLPLQYVEGFGGIIITGSAYLINPSEEGKVFGLPGLSVTYVNVGDETHGSLHRV
ncbi:MAG: hypothetical protein H8D23_10095 [Candidatus Brocadiales bacterium]|nr:hypothetical protein [Candidatus Brocadiales bacterium]